MPLALVAWIAEPAAAQGPGPGVGQVTWALVPEGCAPPASGIPVPCGGYGDFYFEWSPGPGCVSAAGSEDPPVYVDRSFANVAPGRGTPPVCVDGACFEPPGGASGRDPWIAILDWHNWHGWTTGWSALQVGEISGHLYPLDGADLTSFLGTQIGDGHVLARLCEVAHVIEQGTAPPVVLNMSFGRLLVSGEDAESGATCDPATLSCQVGRVLDHLRSTGVVAAAAAGNHGQSLFPAAYDTVLATGALDLAVLADTGAIAPTWETPAAFETLAPGYGVCLEVDGGGSGPELLWPAPPGTSYASAIFAGWLADRLVAHPVADPLAIDWTPRWSDSAGCYVLSDLDPPRCNLGANRILARVLDPTLPNCWELPGGPSLTATASAIPEPEVWRRQPSLAERVEARHAPTPESDPCVPCTVNCPDSPTTSDDKSALTDPVLDLSASSPLPSELHIEQLYLRVGEDFHLLLDRAFASEATKLDSLAAATVDSLVLPGTEALFVPGRQASLFYRLCDTTAGCFWSSLPILEAD